MFNSQRYQKNKSIKKVSPKSRRTAELYKSSHNIGNRTAAERVGSYKETEVALVYPEGFWEAVKVDDGSNSPLEGQSRSRSRSPKSSPRSPYNELSPTRSNRRTTYSPCALPLKRKARNSDSTSSESSSVSDSDSESSHSMPRDTKVSFDTKAGARSSSAKSGSGSGAGARRGGGGSSRECSEERNHVKKNSKAGGGAGGGGAGGAGGGAGNGKAGGKAPAACGQLLAPLSRRAPPSGGVRPRAPRIKRTACLNAAAIVGLLYESDEPAQKKRKVEVEEETSMDSEELYDLQFDLDLKRALAASLEDTPPAKSKKGSGHSSSGKEKEKGKDKEKDKETHGKASCDSTSKKPSSKDKDKGKKDKTKEKDRERDTDKEKGKEKSKDSKKETKDSKDKKVKKSSKEKDKGDKAKVKSKKDTSKKVVSKKVKHSEKSKDQKKTKESNKTKRKEDSKKKEDAKKREEIRKKEETSSDSESEESESEDDQKKEEDVPLWPPPKRMASLNATAILAASKEPRKLNIDRAARIVIYVKDRSKKDVLPRRPKTDLYRSRHETGRWVDGLGTDELENKKNYDPYAFHDSPVEVADVERDTPSPEIQILAVDAPPARSVSPPTSVPPSPSPEVQIIEVRSAPPPPPPPPSSATSFSAAAVLSQKDFPYQPQASHQRYSKPPLARPLPPPPAAAAGQGVPLPPHQVSRPSMHPTPLHEHPLRHSPVVPPHSHHRGSQRLQPLPAHHPHIHPQQSQPQSQQQQQHSYYHHGAVQAPAKPFPGMARHIRSPPPPPSSSGQHHSSHHGIGQSSLLASSQVGHHSHHTSYGLSQASLTAQGSSASESSPTQAPQPPPPPPAHQPHPHILPTHRPPSIKTYDEGIIDRMPTPSQTPPVAQPGYPSSGHGYAHQSGPMGNACTYPYAHGAGGGSGAAGAAGPPAGPQNSHCQGFPFGSMGSVSSYHMMACHSRPFGSAFSVPNFNHHSFVYFAGYYPADGLMDAFGEATTCCMPLSYHIHQQQVKVLVHNTAIPPYPTGPNPYHHPTPTPTVTPITDPPPAAADDDPSTVHQKGLPRDTKPTPSLAPLPRPAPGPAPPAPPIVAHPEVPEGSSGAGSVGESYQQGAPGEQEAGRTYKPERSEDDAEAVRYKVEAQPTPPACCSREVDGQQQQQQQHQQKQQQQQHQQEQQASQAQPLSEGGGLMRNDQISHRVVPTGGASVHKEEKIDVTDDMPVDCPCRTPERPVLTLAPPPAGPGPQQQQQHPPVSRVDVGGSSQSGPGAPEVLETKVEKRSPSSPVEKRESSPSPPTAPCKPEPAPTPEQRSPPPHGPSAPTATSATAAAQTNAMPAPPPLPTAVPLPPTPPPRPTADPMGEPGGPSTPADKAAKAKTEEGEANMITESSGPKASLHRTGDRIESIAYTRDSNAIPMTIPKTEQLPTTTDKKDINSNSSDLIGQCVLLDFDRERCESKVRTETERLHACSVENNADSCDKQLSKETCANIDVLTTSNKTTEVCVHLKTEDVNGAKRCGEEDVYIGNGDGKGKKTSENNTKRKRLKTLSKEGTPKKGEKSISKTSSTKSSTSKVINATLKAGKSCSSPKLSKKEKTSTKVKKNKESRCDKSKVDSKQSKLKKRPASEGDKGDKKKKLKKDVSKSNVKTTKVKGHACQKVKCLKSGANIPKKKPANPKQKKEDIPSKSKKEEALSPPKVKIEPCSPKIKREREDSVSPKPVPSSKQLRIDTSSPKLPSPRASPKPRRESSVSPKPRKQEAPSPRPRQEEAASPRPKRSENSSPRQRREEANASPKIRYRDQLPTNKVLRVHVEALNPKAALAGPKGRDASSPRPRGESLSPRQQRPDRSVSPGQRREDERSSSTGSSSSSKVMLGPRKMVPVKRAPPAYSGWHWEGQPQYKQMITPEAQTIRRKCYPAIRHDDGDIIQLRDCVLVRSGPRKKDIPYVAKIGEFWEDPETAEMMMTIMWYYRPEQAESDRLPRHIACEVYASKHRDEASIACIDDKCFVLTFNEYCRYKSHQKQREHGFLPHTKLVPRLEDPPPAKRQRIPRLNADPETVFLCRRVYDFKLKRILKNPTAS